MRVGDPIKRTGAHLARQADKVERETVDLVGRQPFLRQIVSPALGPHTFHASSIHPVHFSPLISARRSHLPLREPGAFEMLLPSRTGGQLRCLHLIKFSDASREYERIDPTGVSMRQILHRTMRARTTEIDPHDGFYADGR